MIKYKLLKPITYGDRTIKELEVAEPTGKTLYTIKKLPFMFTADGDTAPLIDVFMDYLSELTQEPLSLIQSLSPVDIFKLFSLVAPFFTQASPKDAQ